MQNESNAQSGDDGVVGGKQEDVAGATKIQENPDSPLWRMLPGGHLQSASGESLPDGMQYELPSRRLTLLVEGRDYLKYRDTFERLLFAEKMTVSQKDAKILQMAMTCLVERMEAVTVETGEPFVRAEMLAG